MLLKVSSNGRPDYIRVLPRTERKRQAAETPDHREARPEEWRAAQQELEIGS